MLEFFRGLLSNDFMPHQVCFLKDSGVVWLHVISDSLIALAYYLIPVLLFRFASRRRDISFKWIFLAFGLFILACGSAHLLAAVTVFNPVYRLEGAVKAMTAGASIATFLLLIPMMPTLIALPSPSELSRANEALAAEVEERRKAEDRVRKVNDELEKRVASRTESLERALADLRAEMARRHEVESQLVHSQKMEAVGRLAGGVAHDFNNLLTIIVGYAEVLRDHVEGDAVVSECGREIHLAAERAGTLTNQLLAFSRRQVTQPRVVNLNENVAGIEKMLRRIIGEDIELHLRLAGALSSTKVDPAQFDQVIMNLAINARDAMPHGGRLTIATANVHLDNEFASTHFGVAPGPHVMVTVADTGDGMDAVTRARIFEPFFTTKKQGKGTGLGLSIVYGIVKQHGGEIEVLSKPGQGTVFRIYFPAVPASPEAASAEAVPRARAAATETVLVVEDDDQLRNLVHAVLAQYGYEVLDTASPDAALRLLDQRSGNIHLLLTDVVMPGMRGPELAARVRAAYPQVKVLFMSGYSEAGRSETPPGADAPLLCKPFTPAQLDAKIREVLRGEWEGGQ